MAELTTDAQALSSEDWFVADSFGFGVEREMKESGEKGGTEDASNMLSFTKVMLRQDVGSDIGDSFVFENSTSESGQPFCYLQYKLDRCSEIDDGRDDLATYQPDTAIIGPGEFYTFTLDPREVGIGPGEPFTFTLDPREVGAIIMEYAVML